MEEGVNAASFGLRIQGVVRVLEIKPGVSCGGFSQGGRKRFLVLLETPCLEPLGLLDLGFQAWYLVTRFRADYSVSHGY